MNVDSIRLVCSGIVVSSFYTQVKKYCTILFIFQRTQGRTSTFRKNGFTCMAEVYSHVNDTNICFFHFQLLGFHNNFRPTNTHHTNFL